jgi:hypothetical protein
MDDIAKLSDYSFTVIGLDDQEKIRYTWALFHVTNFMELFQISKELFYQFLIII